MGDYLSKLNQIRENIYANNLPQAANDLRKLLNCIYQDYRAAKDLRAKLTMERTLRVMIPVKDELAQGIVSDNAIRVLNLDFDRLRGQEPEDSVLSESENDFFNSLKTPPKTEPVPVPPKKEAPKPEPEPEPEEEEEPEPEPAPASNPPAAPKKKDNRRGNDLAPLTLNDYIGQAKAKEMLNYSIQAAKIKGTGLNHIMICSPYGLGKTTLANIIANEMDTPFINVNAVSLSDTKSLTTFFINNVNDECIIFIDEIHTLSKSVQTLLLTIITDFSVEFIDENGETQHKDLPHFTLIGATTQAGELLKPFINRFQIIELVDYSDIEKIQIVRSKFDKLGYSIDDVAVVEVAKRSRGVPRTMEIFAKGITDIALTLGSSTITQEICLKYFGLNEIDDKGLNKTDLMILRVLAESDRPLGLITLESKTGIQREDLEFRYEPYLIKLDLLEKTEKGRVITPTGKMYVDSKDNRQ